MEQYNWSGKRIDPIENTMEKGIFVTGGGKGTLELPNKNRLHYSSYSVGDKKHLDSTVYRFNNYDYIVKIYLKNLMYLNKH
ncbi:hypothetical protein D3C78_1870230 [compost metagenome]